MKVIVSLAICLCALTVVFAGEDDGNWLIPVENFKVGRKGILSGDGSTPLVVKVVRIIDQEAMIVSYARTKLLWLQGFDTSGRVDRDEMKMSMRVHISNTKQFNGRTMFFVEPLPEDGDGGM